jgi:hypothetical protein
VKLFISSFKNKKLEKIIFDENFTKEVKGLKKLPNLKVLIKIK